MAIDTVITESAVLHLRWVEPENEKQLQFRLA